MIRKMCPKTRSIGGVLSRFLDASSVRPSDHRSVRPLVGDAFAKNEENHYFLANNFSRRYNGAEKKNDTSSYMHNF